MGSYENTNVMATAQYLTGDRQSVRRRGRPAPGRVVLRRGPSGSDGLGGHRRARHLRPGRENDGDAATPLIFGGAHWSEVGRGRLGIVVSLEQTSSDQLGAARAAPARPDAGRV